MTTNDDDDENDDYNDTMTTITATTPVVVIVDHVYNDERDESDDIAVRHRHYGCRYHHHDAFCSHTILIDLHWLPFLPCQI